MPEERGNSVFLILYEKFNHAILASAKNLRRNVVAECAMSASGHHGGYARAIAEKAHNHESADGRWASLAGKTLV